MYDTNNNAIEQAKQVIEVPMLKWELERALQDNQMMRNLLSSLQMAFAVQDLDEDEREDWIMAIEKVCSEVRDYGNDDNGLEGAA